MRRIALCLFSVLFLAMPLMGAAEEWQFEQAAEEPAGVSGTTLYIVNCEQSVTLRAAPSEQAEALAQVPLGAAVVCYGDVENAYSEVEYQGLRGYVASRYLGWSSAPASAPAAGETMYVVNCTQYVNLRAQPDVASASLAQIPLGAAVTAYESDGAFRRVLYGGATGYVAEEYLSAAPQPFGAYLGTDPGLSRLDTSGIEAYASSEQINQYGYYAAGNANDADASTAWAEGADGLGEGEWLSLFFDERVIAGFAIRAGYQRTAQTYNDNARPAQIRVSVAGEADALLTLDDSRDEQIVLFTRPTLTDYLSIEIVSAYSGTNSADTCISDVRVLLAQ
ncbi:MAG TPA: SH3 domain-containing protein [Candidatus Pullichristensenella avicola]|nr:SH3 domain-containing protein [Candidatus Pullichristensenella avicola]